MRRLVETRLDGFISAFPNSIEVQFWPAPQSEGICVRGQPHYATSPDRNAIWAINVVTWDITALRPMELAIEP